MDARLLTASLAVLLLVACPSPPGGSPQDGGQPKDAGGSPEDAGHAQGPITVKGRVVYAAYGEPFPGVVVTLNGHTVTTGADGSFTFDAVPTPYDLVVAYPSGAQTIQRRVLGLTRADPVVESDVSNPSPPPNHQVFVSGTLSGITFPLATNHVVSVLSLGPSNNLVQGNLTTSGEYTIAPGWRGTDAGTRNIYAFEYTVDGPLSLPVAFGGYGKITPTLNDGVNLTGQNITLTEPTTATFTAQVQPTFPPDKLFASAGIELEPGCLLDFSWKGTASQSLTLPLVTGADGFYLMGIAQFLSVDAYNYFAAPMEKAGGSYTVPTGAPVIIGPADGTTYSPSLLFGWTGPAGATYLFTFFNGTGTKLEIETTQTQVTLPADFAPVSGNVAWQVSAYPDAPNTDALQTANAFDGQRNIYTSHVGSVHVP